MTEEIKPDDVIDIKNARENQGKRGKKRVAVDVDGGSKPKEKKGKDFAELYMAIIRAINKDPLNTLGDFPGEYFTLEVDTGICNIIERMPNGVVREVSPTALARSIIHFTQTTLGGKKEFGFTADHARKCVDLWNLSTAPVPRPPYVRFKSDPGLCWHRITFDPIEDHQTKHMPTWERLMSRIEDTDARMALIAWIGSLFFLESYIQQYAWIYGPGGNGKGALGRFIHKLFEGASHSVTVVPKEPDKFWVAQFEHKRVAIFHDCEAHHFPASGLLKTLTGGDSIAIEKKFKEGYNTSLDTKFLFSSNQMPSLSSEPADRRRAILVKMEGNTCGQAMSWQADFEDKLWEEAPYFVWLCLETYKQYCPGHCPIPVRNADLDDWVSTLEEPFELVMHRWFRIDKDAHVVPLEMQTILRQEFPKRYMQLEFLKWLERTHGVRKRTQPDKTKAYRGIIRIIN